MNEPITPAYAPLISDRETPVSAFHKLKALSPTAFLLESADGDSRMARFSLIGVSPSLTVTFINGVAYLITRDGQSSQEPFDNPLHWLRQTLARMAPSFQEALTQLPAGVQALPFLGGWVGYLGYAATRYFDDIPQQADDPLAIPDGAWGLYDTVLVFDHLYRRLHAVSLGGDAQLQAVLAALDQPAVGLPPLPLTRLDSAFHDDWAFDQVHSHFSADAFADLVRHCQQFVREGQVFQIVPSHRFSLPLRAEPYTAYRLLQAINPSPYGYYLQYPGFAYLGASPETFLTCDAQQRVILRALAGTRPRGLTPVEDEALKASLLSDDKELAEHRMLVDLGRNDLGRVCRVGSIKVGEIGRVVRYTHVMHLSTELLGTLNPDKTAFDMAQSCFPRGTLTGAPKIRAMQLLSRLEPERRGIYAGLVGYFDHRGLMDSAIAIRSAVVKDGLAHVNAGAGVVYDSNPVAEYEETRSKARSVLMALQLANQLEAIKP